MALLEILKVAKDILCKIIGYAYRMNFEFDIDVNGIFTLDLEFQSKEVEMKIPYLLTSRKFYGVVELGQETIHFWRRENSYKTPGNL